MSLPPKVIDLGKRIEEFLRIERDMDRGIREAVEQGKDWPAGWLGAAGKRNRLLRELSMLEHEWGQVSTLTVADLNARDEVLAEIERLQSRMDGHNVGSPLPVALGDGEPCGASTPEALVSKLRAAGVTDNMKLAASVDEHFPGLSYAKLGELLPANPGATIGYDGKKSQGQRLRLKK